MPFSSDPMDGGGSFRLVASRRSAIGVADAAAAALDTLGMPKEVAVARAASERMDLRLRARTSTGGGKPGSYPRQHEDSVAAAAATTVTGRRMFCMYDLTSAYMGRYVISMTSPLGVYQRYIRVRTHAQHSQQSKIIAWLRLLLSSFLPT